MQMFSDGSSWESCCRVWLPGQLSVNPECRVQAEGFPLGGHGHEVVFFLWFYQ